MFTMFSLSIMIQERGFISFHFAPLEDHIQGVLHTTLTGTYMVPLLCYLGILQFLFCKFMLLLQARKRTHYSIRNLGTPLGNDKGNTSGSSVLQSAFFPFRAFF